MANTKEYKIVINGITESVKAVESLNKELASLESRIKSLEGKSVGVKTSGGGSKSSSTGSLSEEEKIAKQIEQIDAKRIAYSKEIYQNYLAAKDVLKETVKDQNAIAASERLQAKSYSNTIMGMKQELADIKSAMQTVDLGDTEKMGEMVKRANELNDALKKIEESYGQFGRNVGNYQSAFDGLSKYKVEIDGVTREFNSAREAAKTLTNELLNLPKGAKGAEGLHEALLKIKSDMADLQKSSSVMDNMLDTMESFTAIANVGQGIRGLFGVNDAEMQKSIKNLVALQNILKGIETINKQMKTGEGVGGWLKPLNKEIDKGIAKLTAYQASLKTTSVAMKTFSIAIKGATLALKAFKAALSFGISIAIDLVLEKVLDLIESFKDASDAEKSMTEATKDGAKAYAEASAKVSGYLTRLKSFNGTKAEEKKLVNEINKEMGTSIGQYKSVDELEKALIQKGEAYAKVMMLQAEAQAYLNVYTENYVKLLAAQKNAAEGGDKWAEWLPWNWGGKSAQEKADEKVAEIEKEGKIILDKYKGVLKEIDNVSKEYNLFPEIENNGKDAKKTIEKVDDELIRLRIRNMKEGLNKTLKQLEEERKAELRKIEGNSREAGEKRLEINKYYNEKAIEEAKNYLQKSEELYDSVNDKIRSYEIKNLNSMINVIQKQIEIQKTALNDKFSDILDQGISSYGIQGKSQLSPEVQLKLHIISEGKDEFTRDMKEFIDLAREAQIQQNLLSALIEKTKGVEKEQTEALKDYIAQVKEKAETTAEAYNKMAESLIENYGFEKVAEANALLSQENYSKKLSTIFNQRYTVYEIYWDKIKTFIRKSADEEQKDALDKENKGYEERKDAALKYYNDQLQSTNDYYDVKSSIIEADYENNLISESEYQDKLANLEKEYQKMQKELEENYEAEKVILENEHTQNEKIILQKRYKELQDINKEYFEFCLQELRDFQTAISNLESKQPVYNFFGTTNFKQTNANNRKLIDSYETLASQILTIKQNLQIKLKNNEITFDDFQSANRELDAFAENVGQKMDEIKYKLSWGGQIQQWVQDWQAYIQALTQSFDQIMNAVWDAKEVQFEKEQEAIDKENEMLNNKLDEQEEIIRQHKDSIDSIEDELSTARGDRRQHLIDQINAEMAAERAAQKQKQKLAKEKEALDKKQEKLDKDRKKAQYNRDMLQAVVNGALAVTMAAVNAWPMPAIAMMAAAAAATAAQIAIMASNKPYAKGGQLDGGVAVGNRHRDGGIKVLGGRAEIEGGEFITNRLTTEKNIDLLDYINSKKKRINLDDLMEFYSSGKVKRNISSISPKAKFADGGTIPTISNDYAFDDRLLSAFEDYSNRPVVVSVVDINNRQSAVKNVQVLAGLPE